MFDTQSIGFIAFPADKNIHFWPLQLLSVYNLNDLHTRMSSAQGQAPPAPQSPFSGKLYNFQLLIAHLNSFSHTGV